MIYSVTVYGLWKHNAGGAKRGRLVRRTVAAGSETEARSRAAGMFRRECPEYISLNEYMTCKKIR